jgi:hypothetical protein
MQNFGCRRATDFRNVKWSTMIGFTCRTLPSTTSMEEVCAVWPPSPLKLTA